MLYRFRTWKHTFSYTFIHYSSSSSSHLEKVRKKSIIPIYTFLIGLFFTHFSYFRWWLEFCGIANERAHIKLHDFILPLFFRFLFIFNFFSFFFILNTFIFTFPSHFLCVSLLFHPNTAYIQIYIFLFCPLFMALCVCHSIFSCNWFYMWMFCVGSHSRVIIIIVVVVTDVAGGVVVVV